MNPFEMVVVIVAIGAVASIFRAKYGIRRDRHGNEFPIADRDAGRDAERMRDELRGLKERIAVLERIATENERGVELDREIERLRDRP